MEIRQTIKDKRDRIFNIVASKGYTFGTTIATEEEIGWLLSQAACDGILFSFVAAPETYQKDNETYYHYRALSIKSKKEKIYEFLMYYSVISLDGLNELMSICNSNDKDNHKIRENLKLIEKYIKLFHRRRNKCLREEQENNEREIIIQSIAAMLRKTSFSFDFEVKEKPNGIKIIYEVTQEEMNKIIETASIKQNVSFDTLK